MNPSITGLILTFNEKENIGRTLAALSWVSEVLIVDSSSTDNTLELARRSHGNIRVVQRQFDTHASQWNFGVEQIATPWVLSLDADYIVTPELAAEISALPLTGDVAGYVARFHYCIWGKRLRASLYPPRAVLFRKNSGCYVDGGHTQVWNSTGRVLPLAGYIEHDDRKPLSRWISSQLAYSKIEARHLLATSKVEMSAQDRLRLGVYFAPPVMFLYLLIVRGLILDGWPGWYYVCQRTIAEMLLSLRLLIEKHGLEAGEKSHVKSASSEAGNRSR